MKNKILVPVLILAALAAFFSFRYAGVGDSEGSDNRRQLIQQTVMRAVRQVHFSPRAINDTFSNRVYTKILDELDFEKKFFTAAEINTLSQYRYKIDDQINIGSVEFFETFASMFDKAVDRSERLYRAALKSPFNFNNDEQLQLSGDNLAYPADENALADRWRMYLKYRVLAKYVDLKDNREKSKDSLSNKRKSDAELEADARTSVSKNMESYFKRFRKIDNNELFAIYINAITGNEDPHTDYFPPRDKQKFDEMMSGSFVGIGAQLAEQDGKIKITAIITGSPCWKQGELKAGDEILKVAQGSAEPVDVQGFEIEDVVKLIRGKKGSEVRMIVKHINGATKAVPIIRGEVLMEETFARSAIINSKEGAIGYIYLPEFYADFNRTSGRHCSEDVAIEVEKMKAANVKGIILDLRNNSGGSLSDVVDMGGLFIDYGPIVQVKSSEAAPNVLRDDNRGTLYDGPLAIMVNENSASASEIMAAAMQDYKRAVIVGSTTYGKGTVQKVIGLDEFADLGSRLKMASAGPESSIGSLKITIQKFYRVNGGSTQLRGVVPDVVLPDAYSKISFGERKDKAALPYDEIPAASYQTAGRSMNLNELIAASRSRVASSQAFSMINQSADKFKRQEEDNTVHLSETFYRKELDEANATSKKMEELEGKSTALAVVNPQEDLARINRDSSSVAKNQSWLKNLKKDIYLAETVNIIHDMNKGSRKLNMGMGMK